MKEGIVEVVYGPMFAGKSSELIRRVDQALISRFKYIVYNPAIDTRYGEGVICNHNKTASIDSTPVVDSIALLRDVVERPGIQKVFIDEAQFFDRRIPEVVDYLSKELKIDVLLAGLLHDFRGEIFGPMGQLVSRAHRVTSMAAICVYELPDGSVCNSPAYFTQRFVNGKPAVYDSPVVMLGGEEEGYTARCEKHWQVPGRPRIDIDTLLK